MTTRANESDKTTEERAISFIRTELNKGTRSKRRQIVEKFVLAALGSIPWVGGFLSAAASLKTDTADQLDNLRTQWLEEHTRKIEYLKGHVDWNP